MVKKRFEIRNDNLGEERRLIISESRGPYRRWDGAIVNERLSPRTYVNGCDGRVSNHISDVVYLPSGRSGRRGGRQHHFAACHPANSPRIDGRKRRFSRKKRKFRPLSKHIPTTREIRKFFWNFRTRSSPDNSNFSNLLWFVDDKKLRKK